VPAGLEAKAIDIILLYVFRQEIRQRHDLMPMPLALDHVECAILAPADKRDDLHR
jgi:hypothetical protein